MEILTGLQKKILNIFSALPDKGAFYLTGGTALSAFFLKHRKSHDLDFFTNIEELISPVSLKLEAYLKKHDLRVERLRGFHSFVELSVNSSEDSTIIHLALDSPFRFEQPTAFEEIPGLKVDSLTDIATNKLLALFGRAVLRDFIDT